MKPYALVAFLAVSLALARQGIKLYLPCPYWAEVVEIPASKLPSPSALEGPYAPNSLLTKSDKLWRGAEKAETVVVTEGGQAYLPTEDGDLLSASLAAPGALTRVAPLGGRPIGMTMHPAGYLVVCDAVKGLLAVDPSTGTTTLLTNRVTQPADLPQAEADIRFADDVAVASDGRIFFSDATAVAPVRGAGGSFDALQASKMDFFSGKPTGRVLVYDPRDRSTAVLVDGLWFANGVALSHDESHLIVAETFGCRLARVWVAGERAGEVEVFVDGLPGFVDGVSSSPDGRSYWAAIITLPQRSVLTMLMAPAPVSRLLRWVAAQLPPALQPQVQPYGLVVQVASNGTVLRSLHDPTGQHCRSISSAKEVGGRLFLGNLGTSWVCALDLAALEAQ